MIYLYLIIVLNLEMTTKINKINECYHFLHDLLFNMLFFFKYN